MKALIDETGQVVNLITDPDSPDWQPPAGLTVIEAQAPDASRAEMGGQWTGSTFVRPVVPSPDAIKAEKADITSWSERERALARAVFAEINPALDDQQISDRIKTQL